MSHFFAAHRLPVFLGVFFVSVLTAACSSDTPEGVVKGYITAIANNRIDEAIGYFPSETGKDQDGGAMRRDQETGYSWVQDRGGLDSVLTSLVDNKNDTAHVKAEIKFKNGETENATFALSKESGKWKFASSGN